MSQETDLQAIRGLVNETSLAAGARSTALWHMDKLPNLYQELDKTCESRFLDEILKYVQAMLKAIEAPQPVTALTIQFQDMHERHGIPRLGLKLPAPVVAKPTRRKKVQANDPVPVQNPKMSA